MSTERRPTSVRRDDVRDSEKLGNEDAGALFESGRRALRHGDLTTALQDLEAAAIESEPSTPGEWEVAYGRALLRAGNYEESRGRLLRAIEQTADPKPAWYAWLGNSESRLGNPEAAVSAYHTAITAASDRARPGWYYRLGVSLHKLARYDEAITAFHTAMKQRDQAPASWHRALARSLSKMDRLEDARAEYASAIRAAPSPNPELYAAHARASMRLEHYADAVAGYQRATSIRGESSPAAWWKGLTKALSHNEEYGHALAALAMALDEYDGARATLSPIYTMARKGARRALRQSQTPMSRSFDPALAAPGYVAWPDRSGITAWLPDDVPPGQVLVLSVNGDQLTSIGPTSKRTLENGTRVVEFRRWISDLWLLLGADDQISVSYDGQPLKFPDGSSEHTLQTAASSVWGTVRELTSRGWTFDKYGRFRRSIALDDTWRHGVVQLMNDVATDVKQEFGINLVAFYGTMLGAVREGDFIKHDADADTAYLSSYTDPEDVKNEFIGLCSFLIGQGYNVRPRQTHCEVHIPECKAKFDIFYAWMTPDGYLDVSFGYHGPRRQFKTHAFFEPRVAKLGEAEVLVPREAEALLEQIYGSTWHIPNPGFRHKGVGTRKRDKRYTLSEEETNQVYWNQFYRDYGEDEPSPFARFAATHIEQPGSIIDLGCGTGRDAWFFARLGNHVVGVDQAESAIEHAQAANGDTAGLHKRASFLVGDITRPDDLTRILEQAIKKASLKSKVLNIYVRFVLHSVNEEGAANILRTLSRFEHPVRLLLEFRTLEDEELQKVHKNHYRRFVDDRGMVEALHADYGFDIGLHERGQGLSPYGDEDPFLARVIATRM